MYFYRTELRSYGWDFVTPSRGNLVWKVREVRNELRDYCHYRVTWVASAPTGRTEQDVMGNGTGFLDTLKQGDRVALARAEFTQHRITWRADDDDNSSSGSGGIGEWVRSLRGGDAV